MKNAISWFEVPATDINRIALHNIPASMQQ